jgi:ATP-dependent DNA ligase
MLGRLARELPEGDLLYEPKWDGFRCLAFRAGQDVDLRSRHDRPLARYFPEVAGALHALPGADLVLDGELIPAGPGAFDFASLMGRLHPAASRVERLAREEPAAFVAFDLLAAGGEDLRGRPFADRRARLEAALADPPAGVHVTPATVDPAVAREWLERFVGGGLDGVVAKPRGEPYREGARALWKVKQERTADCVVGGIRLYANRPELAALLLGVHDEEGRLVHIGVASSFARERRRALLEELSPLSVPLEGHPWEQGFLLGGGPLGRLKGSAGRWRPGMDLDWIPLAPVRVCEVAYEQVDGRRLRHPARFRRWRPDREPASCGVEQLEVVAPPPREVLAA